MTTNSRSHVRSGVPRSTRVPAVAITIIGVLACVMILFTNAIAVIAVAIF